MKTSHTYSFPTKLSDKEFSSYLDGFKRQMEANTDGFALAYPPRFHTDKEIRAAARAYRKREKLIQEMKDLALRMQRSLQRRKRFLRRKKTFTIVRKTFFTEEKTFTTQGKTFSTEIKTFSTARKMFLLGRKTFLLERKTFFFRIKTLDRVVRTRGGSMKRIHAVDHKKMDSSILSSDPSPLR